MKKVISISLLFVAVFAAALLWGPWRRVFDFGDDRDRKFGETRQAGAEDLAAIPVTVEVMVRNSDGSPCPGAVISVRNWRLAGLENILQIDAAEDEVEFRTDAFGLARCVGLSAGNQRIIVQSGSKIGYASFLFPKQDAANVESTKTRRVSEKRIDVFLSSARRFEIRVRDDRNLAVANGLLMIADPTPERAMLHFRRPVSPEVLTARTNAAGQCLVFLLSDPMRGIEEPKSLRLISLRYGGEHSDQTFEVARADSLVMKVPKTVSLELRPRKADGSAVENDILCYWTLKGRNPSRGPPPDDGVPRTSLDHVIRLEFWRQVCQLSPQGYCIAAFAPAAELILVLGSGDDCPAVTTAKLSRERVQKLELRLGLRRAKVRFKIIDEEKQAYLASELQVSSEIDSSSDSEFGKFLKLANAENDWVLKDAPPGFSRWRLSARSEDDGWIVAALRSDSRGNDVKLLIWRRSDLGFREKRSAEQALAEFDLSDLLPGETRDLGVLVRRRHPVLAAGMVVGKDGLPRSGVRLRVRQKPALRSSNRKSKGRSLPNYSFATTSKIDGRFEIRGKVRPGYTNTVAVDAYRSQIEANVEFEPGDSNLSLTGGRPGAISGRLVTVSPELDSWLRFEIFPVGSEPGFYHVHRSGSGVFNKIALAPGLYTARVKIAGIEVFRLEAIRVESGKTTRPEALISLVVGRHYDVGLVTVLAADGKPLRGAGVNLDYYRTGRRTDDRVLSTNDLGQVAIPYDSSEQFSLVVEAIWLEPRSEKQTIKDPQFPLIVKMK
ncbi:MAG: carboxypeptidase-like regulatory domain-containing protein [Planctomycetota bacterium]